MAKAIGHCHVSTRAHNCNRFDTIEARTVEHRSLHFVLCGNISCNQDKKKKIAIVDIRCALFQRKQITKQNLNAMIKWVLTFFFHPNAWIHFLQLFDEL